MLKVETIQSATPCNHLWMVSATLGLASLGEQLLANSSKVTAAIIALRVQPFYNTIWFHCKSQDVQWTRFSDRLNRLL